MCVVASLFGDDCGEDVAGGTRAPWAWGASGLSAQAAPFEAGGSARAPRSHVPRLQQRRAAEEGASIAAMESSHRKARGRRRPRDERRLAALTLNVNAASVEEQRRATGLRCFLGGDMLRAHVVCVQEARVLREQTASLLAFVEARG